MSHVSLLNLMRHEVRAWRARARLIVYLLDTNHCSRLIDRDPVMETLLSRATGA